MSQSSAPTRSTPGQARDDIRFADRLLTEAVRIYERDGARRLTLADDVASTAADFEARLVQRARSLPMASTMRGHLRWTARLGRWLWIALLAVGVIIGAGLAGILLRTTDDEPVNFYWLLFVAFGVQSVALLLWMVLAAIPMVRRSPGWIGRAVLSTAQWIVRRLHADEKRLAALRASLTVLRTPALSRWTLGAVSHSMWLVANVSFLLLAITMLSMRSYTFQWQTTILPDDVFVRITQWVAWAPSTLGFATPTAEQIARCGPGADASDLAAARTAWAALLIGCIVIYGLLPRAALLSASLIGASMARRRFRLNLSLYERGYADLRPSLRAGERGLRDPSDRGLDEDIEELRAAHRSDAVAPVRPLGPAMLLAVELPFDVAAEVPGAQALFPAGIQRIDGSTDANEVMRMLEAAEREPNPTIIAFDFNATADRGHASLALSLQQRLRQPLYVILTGGERWRADHGDDARSLRTRLTHWQALLERAGISAGRLVQCDLEYLTAYAIDVLHHRWPRADHPHDSAQGLHTEHDRFAAWQAARTILSHLATSADASSAPILHDAQHAMHAIHRCFLSPHIESAASETDTAAPIKISATQLRERAVASVRQSTHQVTYAVQHPIRAALRRMLSRSPAHQAARGAPSHANAAGQPTAFTSPSLPILAILLRAMIVLDLQGRCDEPTIAAMLQRIYSEADHTASPIPAQHQQQHQHHSDRWCDHYEQLCRAEGIQ